MQSSEHIGALFQRYGGVMRRHELTQEGVHACTLHRMQKAGLIQKPRVGYYEWVAEEGPNEAALILRLFPEAVMCMQSALYVYEYTDRVPSCWHLAVPQDAARSKYSRNYPRVKAYFRTPESLQLGVTTATIEGKEMPIYDRERTICDCIAQRNRMDREIFVKAIRAYCEDSRRNIPRLMEYAARLRLEKTTRDIISLWQ